MFEKFGKFQIKCVLGSGAMGEVRSACNQARFNLGLPPDLAD